MQHSKAEQMGLDVDGLVQHYRDQARTFIEGRPWLVATDVLVSAARMGSQLMELGAERVLAIGASRGVGDLPPPEQVQCIELGLAGETDMMEAIHQSGRALANLPDWVLAEVERFDPDRELQK